MPKRVLKNQSFFESFLYPQPAISRKNKIRRCDKEQLLAILELIYNTGYLVKEFNLPTSVNRDFLFLTDKILCSNTPTEENFKKLLVEFEPEVYRVIASAYPQSLYIAKHICAYCE
jgi:hypothetical protein